MTHVPNFIVGKTYLTQAGKRVTIIAESRDHRGYECVQGDDGQDVFENGIMVSSRLQQGWRYDREGDVGRVTGSASDPNCWLNPDNLVPGEV